MLIRLGFLALALAGISQAAMAQQSDDFGNGVLMTPQQFRYVSPGETVRAELGFGAMLLEAQEYVFNGNYRLSQLNWQSRVPVLRGALSINPGGGFSVRAEASIAAYGTSYMEDYDWLGGSDADENWTHRSQHPDTRVDHYFTGSLMGGYEIYRDSDSSVRLDLGAKYSDVQWTAYGGTYLYSTTTLRDTPGSIPDGTPGITYQQRVPELFAGVAGEVDYGAVRWGGMMRGGVTLFTRADDDHWLRDLHFVDWLVPAPTISLGTDVSFELGQHAQLFMAARYDQIIRARGNTEVFDTVTGTRTQIETDAGSDELRSIELTGGFKGTF